MASRSRVIVGVVLVLAIGLGHAARPDPIVAAGACRAGSAILGQTPGLTGPTPTDWFNVFGEDFDPTVPATLTFGVPVIPWTVEQPSVVQPAVTAFSMPAQAMSSGFKWTFRARDPGVLTISLRISGEGCQASTLVDFSAPATSTADGGPGQRDRPPAEPLLLLLSFTGSALALNRRLGHSPKVAQP
jgi:hypothetical protein